MDGPARAAGEAVEVILERRRRRRRYGREEVRRTLLVRFLDFLTRLFF